MLKSFALREVIHQPDIAWEIAWGRGHDVTKQKGTRWLLEVQKTGWNVGDGAFAWSAKKTCSRGSCGSRKKREKPLL